ncbi:hypothetical protein RRG08_045655 [Elysia crispata]|uniref:Uncharacterized protein n=1 Tax=Elysia crispata TaxID=231223 RepID=A0AAE0YLL5_9GAST|nr:hypothetical protein RRG08_045655 [Elysia crispata]
MEPGLGEPRTASFMVRPWSRGGRDLGSVILLLPPSIREERRGQAANGGDIGLTPLALFLDFRHSMGRNKRLGESGRDIERAVRYEPVFARHGACQTRTVTVEVSDGHDCAITT